jgi:RNA polymerase sigma factor (sigma-70 family)
MPLSDNRLVRQAARGDRHAFEAIYRRYHQDLYRFCLALVGGNPQDAQDALQNTMVKVLRALPGEERRIQLKPWLYRIARNEAIETLRRRRDNVELEPELTVSGEEIVQTVEDRERLRLLLLDLEALPERQRAALVMRELAGLDFDQIGEAFGSSPAVARQTLYEARLSLRQMEGGREMRCEEVMRELSDADGRVTRRRELRAHLRSCPACRAFRDEIDTRRGELAALAPLPLAASAGLLHGVLGAAGSGASSGAGVAASATAGQAVATSAIVKSAATVAVAVVVGVSAADRSGLIDLPIAGRSHPSAQSTSGRQGLSPGNAGASGSGTTARRPSASAGPKARRALRMGHRVDRNPGRDQSSANPQATAVGGGDSSRSEEGLSPPGGGNGRTASERRHGRPDRLPAASEHGQQTAAAHKPAGAPSPHSHGPTGHAHGKSSTGGSEQPPKPAPPPKPKVPPTTPGPAQPPAEAPSPGKGKAAEAPPTGLED